MRAIAKAQVSRLALQDHLIRILIIFRVPTSETCRHGTFVARLASTFDPCHGIDAGDRKSGVSEQNVSVRVDLDGCCILNKNNNLTNTPNISNKYPTTH